MNNAATETALETPVKYELRTSEGVLLESSSSVTAIGAVEDFDAKGAYKRHAQLVADGLTSGLGVLYEVLQDGRSVPL